MSLKQAFALHQEGRLAEAEAIYLGLIQMKPEQHQVMLLLGALYVQCQRFDQALDWTYRSLKLEPDNSQAQCNLGAALEGLNRLEDALASLDKAVILKADYPLAWFNRGNVLTKLKRYELAAQSYAQACHFKPDDPEAWMNHGLALQSLRQFDDALLSQERALSLKPNYAEAWCNKGNILLDLKRSQEAISCYQHALSLKPHYVEAFVNKGNALFVLHKPLQAITQFKQALTLDSKYLPAYCNLGATYQELEQFDQALTFLQTALSLAPDDTDVNIQLLSLYAETKQFDEAIVLIKKLRFLQNDKSLDFELPQMFIQMRKCDWHDLPQAIQAVRHRILEDKLPSELLPLLAISDDLLFLKQAAIQYTQKQYPLDHNPQLPESPGLPSNNQRVAIGYFSSDFRQHAVSILTAELFELHDRSKFELHAFYLGHTTPRDATTERIAAAVDHFWDCRQLDDEALLALTRKYKLAVAVDLNGATKGCRTSLFAKRLAPIQINYLGFPGSMGTPYHDYIIADDYVVPDNLAHGYTEKIMRLPCFQVNDRKRKFSTKRPTRSEFGLPEDAMVYCCFNNTYKITPVLFDAWMGILKQVDRGVLWLLSDTEHTHHNLQRRAEQAGVNPQRLVFAASIGYEDYMARYHCADVFLDTFPFNAGTTASDALWMGLPLVTYSGDSFASRMAGSLLHAVGLPELIASDIHSYQALAVELSLQPEKLQELRRRLIDNRDSCLLFDTPQFTRNLEAAYLEVIKQPPKN